MADDKKVDRSGGSVDDLNSLKKENEELKKQLEEMNKTLKSSQEELARLKGGAGSSGTDSGSESGTQSSTEELKFDKLYKWGKSKVEKQDVQDAFNSLGEPHKSKIREFINGGKVKELQQYFNGLVDDGTIDGSELKSACESKGIRLDGKNHISADGKFGPQTVEAMRMLKGKGSTGTTSTETSGTSLDTMEDKYANVSTKLDFSKSSYFKTGVLADDGSLTYSGETYKKVENGDSSYEGLGYSCREIDGYKCVTLGTFKNGKISEGIRIYDDGEKHIGKFSEDENKTIKLSGHVIYPDSDKSGRKEYSGDFLYGKGPHGKGKLSYTNGRIQEGTFENGKFIDGTDNMSKTGNREVINNEVKYEGDYDEKGEKLDATWLNSHKGNLAKYNNMKGKTFDKDGGYKEIIIGHDDAAFNKGAYYKSDLVDQKTWNSSRGIRLVESDMKDARNGEVSVTSWGKTLKFKVESGTCKFVAGNNTLTFNNLEDAYKAADLINYARFGMKNYIKIKKDSNAQFSKFEKCSNNGIEIEYSNMSSDGWWINTNVENHFGGNNREQIINWMNAYFESLSNI